MGGVPTTSSGHASCDAYASDDVDASSSTWLSFLKENRKRRKKLDFGKSAREERRGCGCRERKRKVCKRRVKVWLVGEFEPEFSLTKEEGE